MQSTDHWASTLKRLARMQPVQRGTLATDTCLESAPFRLLRYQPPATSPQRALPPILLVYSLVNRPDLLDLAPGRSLVQDLIDNGFPVYLVDWGYPIAADRGLGLEDYVPGFLGQAVDKVLDETGRDRLILAGVCQGGTLSLCHALARPAGIGLLATLATPVDFHAERNALSRLAETLPTTDEPDNLSGELLSAAFAALKPMDLLIRRYQSLPDPHSEPERLEEFLRMEAWMYDCPDQPAMIFRQFVEEFYLENRLARGELAIGGRRLRLADLAMPALNVYAEHDHLVPAASARALGDHLQAERYSECALPGGHLGVFLSRQNRKRFIPSLISLAEKMA